ncbi:DUF2851 family protein [Flavobacterium capsici]|uniref:DUF2851 family protein n=1 Tax=Flavobacterium capsici TaxID=3075618 RepID=A0AA96J4E7_9FLAO|nr:MULTISPECIES: DUF2851 family protein [unclassified Flavobacterium]WNM20428.1 DUF2851 family protein [Flavobacterium sp. PMR2A8]WNM23135.1 DUF2851 family protein [Flavobacterium sp. PMTSA4]
MKEDFLHYVWQYKKFDFSNLKTVNGESLSISNVGNYFQKSGPDFFNAQITIENQKWAGNIEIHIKSSDWYLHQHEKDDNYNNVVLHVVWEHDTPIFRKDNSEIPTLELKHYVSKEVLENYQSLVSKKSWIYCENQIKQVDDFIFQSWKERLFFERLERKSIPIQKLLEETDNDWEAVLFCLLSKNFGLNTNGETFLKMAQSVPFSVIRKEGFEVENLEALFLGRTDLIPLDAEDNYTKDLKSNYDYISHKYQLQKTILSPVQFFKHRPDNFPTIRLAQLAMLYHQESNLFSRVISINKLKDFYSLFEVETSSYWLTHYQLDNESVKKKKKLSKSFIDLIVINTIVPIQFAYAKSLGKESSETILELIREIKPEKNVIIQKFNQFGLDAINAFDSQSLLQLKNEYCNLSKCLQCNVGIQLLKS